MSAFAQSKVYKIGRINILIGLLAAPASAWAQAEAPAGAQVPAQPPSAPVASPEAAPVAPTLAADAALQGRLDALEQRTHLLESSLASAQAAAAAGPRSATTIETDGGGFAITSPDRQYQIRFKGVLQIDGRRIFDNTPLQNTVDTFIVRRARPIIGGTLLGLTDFLFVPDFGNNTVALFDAYADTHPFPWLRLRVGKFKGPVGLERLQADADISFVERSLTQNLSPQREVGLELWGDIAGGIVRYEAGVFNGNPDNGNNDIDSDHAKSFEGRLLLQPFSAPSLRPFGRLALGVAASTGNELGTATNTWVGAFKSFSQSTIFSYLATTTANTVFAKGRHTRVNPQLYYYFGPFGLLAEWVHEYQQLSNSIGSGSVNNSAGNVAASFVIGGDATYEGVKPHHDLDLASGGYGALEIGARYNWLDIDHASFPTASDPSKSINRARAFGVGLGWQMSRNLRAAADYEQTWFDGGAAKSANRTTEKMGIARFQVAF
jgi:phosphate-selective porin OprO/OprP